MIYFFTGSDIEKTRTKAFEWIAKAREKQPELSYLRLAREELSPGALEDAASAGGLFTRKLLVLLDDPFPASRKSDEDEEGSEEAGGSLVEEAFDTLVKSENAIVILAPKLAIAKAKKIEAKAEKTYRFDAREAKEVRGFNGALVNALAAGDSGKLWLEVERALIAGDAPEQVHGLLHWKARDLMQKGKAGSRELSLALITLLADSRRKGLDLAESLERFALSL